MHTQVIFYSLETQFPQCLTLQKIRQQRGLTLLDVSAVMRSLGLTPVSPSHLSGFENGTEKAWNKARRELAIAFQMSETELFPEYLDCLGAKIKLAGTPATKIPRCRTLQKKRLEAGLALFGLAILLVKNGLEPIEPRILSGFENGDRRASKKARRNLAIALQVPELELFPEYDRT